MSPKNSFLNQKLKVVNIGIPTFADDLLSQEVEVVHVEWSTPAGGRHRDVEAN